ncbi:MAG: tellurium resistance protein TerC [Deltaproteobacteria bacterium]|nr:tellurium resistance protein TerC [Deltaproteobacteria bacterium]
MADLFTFENFANLGVLLFLQAVLGFDNLLYISIESKRAPAEQQQSVRRNAILIAIGLRIVLLFLMVNLLETFTEPLFTLEPGGVIEGKFNFSVIVFLLGGAFIMYTAVKEIGHMMAIEDLSHDVEAKEPKTAAQVIAMLVLMNLVFSFDSILSALAITEVFPVLALAIVGSGLAMLLLADRVSEFLQRNRKYEVLGLFILLIVGVVLLGEGGEEAHMKLFGYAIEAMSKSTFYFSIVVLVLVDVIQGRYQAKLQAQRALAAGKTRA